MSPPGAPAWPGAAPGWSGQPGRTPGGWAADRPGRGPAARVNPFAIAALVLGCVAVVPVAMVFAIVGLRQIRRRGERGRGLAIGGLVASGVWLALIALVVVVAVTTGVERDDEGRIVEGGSLSVFDLRVGDCLDDVPDDEEFRSLPAVPCADPHEGEVYAVFDLPAGGFPGVTEVADLAEAGCNDRADVLPPAVVSDVTLGLFTITPSEESWDTGDREVSCLVLSRAAPRTGSVFDR